MYERILRPDYLDGLQQRPLDDVRAMRTECIDIETGFSYLRRMVQGPLDIVKREIERRANGESTDLATLLAELPDTLSDTPRPPGLGRLSQTLEPTRLDAALLDELDALVGSGRLGTVTDMDDDALAALAAQLTSFELRVSDQRRAFFDIIDSLQAEIARRYRDGEASVDALLNEH